MSIDLLQKEIRRFLTSADAEVLCISGKWGVGKTFAWNKYLNEADEAGTVGLKRYSYVSLFGRNSLDDVRSAIFENTVPLTGAPTKPNVATLVKTAEAVFSAYGDQGFQVLASGPGISRPIEGTGNLELLQVFPTSTMTEVHSSVPAAASQFFMEAEEDLRNGRNAAGVINKCRSVLDLCLKQLGASGAGRKARIADLRTKGLLTLGLANWADRLWDDGNEAIHDLTGDEKQAREHVSFLRLFFSVAFALPAQVAAAQAAADHSSAGPKT